MALRPGRAVRRGAGLPGRTAPGHADHAGRAGGPTSWRSGSPSIPPTGWCGSSPAPAARRRPTPAAADGPRSAQVDGARWLSLEGPVTVSDDPARVAAAVAAYTARYRSPPEPDPGGHRDHRRTGAGPGLSSARLAGWSSRPSWCGAGRRPAACGCAVSTSVGSDTGAPAGPRCQPSAMAKLVPDTSMICSVTSAESVEASQTQTGATRRGDRGPPSRRRGSAGPRSCGSGRRGRWR